MAIRYSLEVLGEVLYFLGEGNEEDLEQDKQVHEWIVRACEEHDCTRILIDDRKVKYTASIIALYELARYYDQIRVPDKIQRVAVLASPDYKESNEFFETTARNRGVDLRVFQQREQAEAWLLESGPRP
jgi:stage II sporulation SpoAA-like protein